MFGKTLSVRGMKLKQPISSSFDVVVVHLEIILMHSMSSHVLLVHIVPALPVRVA